MTRINRIALSFLSALASELVVMIVLWAKDIRGSRDFLVVFFGLSIFVIPGWLLSLPLVILFDRADDWRFWVLGFYGTLLGPAIIFAWAVVCKITEGTPIIYFVPIGGIALVIALLSTALYLYFFKTLRAIASNKLNHDC